MNDELIERLRRTYRKEYAPIGSTVGSIANYLRPYPLLVTDVLINPDGPAAADEIERLTAEVRRLDHSTTHTCWDECPRLACAQRREIEALTAELARAKQEGWNAGIEAAAGEARDCALYDGNQRLLHSDIRATCAEAIRALAMPDPVRDTVADSDGDDGA